MFWYGPQIISGFSEHAFFEVFMWEDLSQVFWRKADKDLKLWMLQFFCVPLLNIGYRMHEDCLQQSCSKWMGWKYQLATFLRQINEPRSHPNLNHYEKNHDNKNNTNHGENGNLRGVWRTRGRRDRDANDDDHNNDNNGCDVFPIWHPSRPRERPREAAMMKEMNNDDEEDHEDNDGVHDCDNNDQRMNNQKKTRMMMVMKIMSNT